MQLRLLSVFCLLSSMLCAQQGLKNAQFAGADNKVNSGATLTINGTLAVPTGGTFDWATGATLTGNTAALRSALDVPATSQLANYQPLSSNLTSWAAVARAAGVDTFLATPTSANLAALVTNETGTGNLVFATAPTLSGATLSGNTTLANAEFSGTAANAWFRAQASIPTSPADGFRFFADASGRLSWWSAGASFYRSFANTSLTANRLYTFPDAPGTFVLDSAPQTLSNKTFVAPILGDASASSISFGNQSLTPAAPASGFVEFADASGRKAWRRANGNVITWDFSAATANRTITWADLSGTPVLTTAAQTLSNKTFSGNTTLSGGQLTINSTLGGADGSAVALAFGTGYEFAEQLSTFNSVQDRVGRFGYRTRIYGGDGDISQYIQFEHRFQNTPSIDSEYFYQWWGPTGVSRRPFQINTSWGTSFGATNPEGYVDFALTGNLVSISGDPSDGFRRDFRFTAPSAEPDLRLEPNPVNKDVRLRLMRYGGAEWMQLTAGSNGTYGTNAEYSLDSVAPAANQRRTLRFRSSANSGSTFTNLASFDFFTPQITFDAPLTVNTTTSTAYTTIAGNTTSGGAGGLLITGGAGSANTIRFSASVITGNNPAIWMGDGGSPSSSNYLLSVSGGSTGLLNATSSLLLRISNGTQVTINSTATTINSSAAATATTNGALIVSGGVGVAGNVVSGGVVRTGSYTVATLPSAATYAGGIAYVTDANSTTSGTTVAGGGSNKVQVRSDGTNWIINN